MVDRFVGKSVIISLKRRTLHFHAPFAELVIHKCIYKFLLEVELPYEHSWLVGRSVGLS